ncbi:hypothetical protein K523DRAFT_62054 [Schizophyllum commune Tattone D]|nr:hypothetical protein K523DRAFT_62054 [Schizophyllum commune Tattone D]
MRADTHNCLPGQACAGRSGRLPLMSAGSRGGLRSDGVKFMPLGGSGIRDGCNQGKKSTWAAGLSGKRSMFFTINGGAGQSTTKRSAQQSTDSVPLF